MKKNKKLSSYVKGMLLSTMLLLSICLIGKIDVHAECKNMNITASVQSFTKTKLKWKKHNVSKYYIYKEDSNGKRKKVKTLSGKSTSYTVTTKKNKDYSYYITGVSIKGKKTTVKYNGVVTFYSGLEPLGWDDYQLCDASVTPTSIELWPVRYDGIKPDGYQIYRKEAGSTSYKKIKTLKKLDHYVDKTVETGKTYYYKIRSYKKIGKKTYYGSYSETVKLSAVWWSAKFTVSGEAEGDAPILTMTSDKGNAVLTLGKNTLNYTGYLSRKDPSVFYVYTAFSKDGTTWHDTSAALTLEAGETVYLSFKPISSDDPNLGLLVDISEHLFIYAGAQYRNITSDFLLDPYAGSATAYPNGESTH